jgi:hypothetical protein
MIYPVFAIKPTNVPMCAKQPPSAGPDVALTKPNDEVSLTDFLSAALQGFLNSLFCYLDVTSSRESQ